LHDVISNGISHEIGYGVQIEFPHDIGSVGFGGLDTEIECHGDLLTGFTFSE
jgi:hypothetical protein